MTCYDAVLNKFQPLLKPGTEFTEEDIDLPHFEPDLVCKLIKSAIQVFSHQETLIRVPTPATIVGDIHGNMSDLLHILQRFPHYKSESLLFLGDYVDRGAHSIAVITLLLALLCKYPKRVFLIRGNHEFSHVNRMYGFFSEIINTYFGDDLWDEFQTVFAWMPLAAVVGDKIFCVHGGLSPQLKGLHQIKDLARPIENYDDDPMVSDLVWSDPNEGVSMYADNERGSGVLFGYQAMRDFLTGVGMKVLVRAHQCVADGYSVFGQSAGVTVFSSSEYCSLMHNRCGVLYVNDKGNIEIYSFCSDDFGVAPPKLVMAVRKDLGMRKVFQPTQPAQPAPKPGMKKKEPETPAKNEKTQQRAGRQHAYSTAPRGLASPVRHAPPPKAVFRKIPITVR